KTYFLSRLMKTYRMREYSCFFPLDEPDRRTLDAPQVAPSSAHPMSPLNISQPLGGWRKCFAVIHNVKKIDIFNAQRIGGSHGDRTGHRKICAWCRQQSRARHASW